MSDCLQANEPMSDTKESTSTVSIPSQQHINNNLDDQNNDIDHIVAPMRINENEKTNGTTISSNCLQISLHQILEKYL